MNLIASGHQGLRPLVGDLTHQKLVLRYDKLNRRFQMPRFQIFHATGGMGCQENAPAPMIYGLHIADGESARWDRQDFIGIASDELVMQALEDTTPVQAIDLDDRVYFVMAKDGNWTKGKTLEVARQRLQRITPAPVRTAFHAHPDSEPNEFGWLSYPAGAEPVEVRIKKRGGIWTDGN